MEFAVFMFNLLPYMRSVSFDLRINIPFLFSQKKKTAVSNICVQTSVSIFFEDMFLEVEWATQKLDAHFKF